MTVNPLWDRIQAYIDDPSHEYRPTPAAIARKAGISGQVLSKWKHKVMLPEPTQLAKVAYATGISYYELLNAALIGKGYERACPGPHLIDVSKIDAYEDVDW